VTAATTGVIIVLIGLGFVNRLGAGLAVVSAINVPRIVSFKTILGFSIRFYFEGGLSISVNWRVLECALRRVSSPIYLVYV
jgi:hypothetical protein